MAKTKAGKTPVVPQSTVVQTPVPTRPVMPETQPTGSVAVSDGVIVKTATDPLAPSGTPTSDVKSFAHTPTPPSESTDHAADGKK